MPNLKKKFIAAMTEKRRRIRENCGVTAYITTKQAGNEGCGQFSKIAPTSPPSSPKT